MKRKLVFVVGLVVSLSGCSSVSNWVESKFTKAPNNGSRYRQHQPVAGHWSTEPQTQSHAISSTATPNAASQAPMSESVVRSPAAQSSSAPVMKAPAPSTSTVPSTVPQSHQNKQRMMVQPPSGFGSYKQSAARDLAIDRPLLLWV